jgi:hypothetical protein
MCGTATARRDALVMLTDLNVDLLQSYDAVSNSQNELGDFMSARQAQAESLISGVAEAYVALSEICARALLATVNETPAYPTQISKMQNFCRLLGNIVAAHKAPLPQMFGYGDKSPLYASVLLTNRRSLQALSRGGFTRKGYCEAPMLEKYREVFDRDWIAVYASSEQYCPTYFALREGNPIDLGARDAYLGYDNIPNQKGESEDRYEREMRGYLGAMNTYGSYYCEDRTGGMFAFFPFEEQRAHIVKNKLSFNRGEQDVQEHILCESYHYRPIFDTAPYRIFALAELCLVRILLRERGAMLNMVQYEIASDALRSLVTATVSAHALYSQQKAAAENARITAEMEAAAAKKAEKPAAKKAEKPAAKKVTVRKVVRTTPNGNAAKKK